MERIALERNCWYCHKSLPLTRLLKQELFCSSEHEQLYFDAQSAAAFERMTESSPPEKPAALKFVKPPAVSGKAPDAQPTDAKPPDAKPRYEEPPYAEQPDVESIPMAPLMKEEVLPCEDWRPSIASEDPLSVPAEPARPWREQGQTEPDLPSAGWIPFVLTDVPQDVSLGGAFPAVPFADRGPDISPRPSQPASVGWIASRRAEPIPLWTSGDAGEAIETFASAEASTPSVFPATIAALATALHSNLSSPPAAPAWADGAATGAGSALPPADEPPLAMGEIRITGALPTMPSPPALGRCGTLTEGAAIGRPDMDCDPACPARFEEAAGQVSKGDTFAGLEHVSFRHCASTNEWRNNAHPLETSGIPRMPTAGVNRRKPTAAIRSLGAAGVCRPVSTILLETTRRAAGGDASSSLKALAQVSSADATAIQAVQRHLAPPVLHGAATSTVEFLTAQPSRILSSLPALRELKSSRAIAIQAAQCDLAPLTLRGAAASTLESAIANPSRALNSLPALRELKSSGAIAIRAERRNLAPLAPQEASASTGEPLTAHPSRTVVSFATQAPALNGRAAGFHAIAFSRLATVTFAAPKNLWSVIADSPPPRFIHARRFEPAPASLAADPRSCPQPAVSLRAGGPIDHRSRPMAAVEYRSALAWLDRVSEPPCRIPESRGANLTAPALRMLTAPAGAAAIQDDSGIAAQIAPLPPVRIQPASIFAPAAVVARPPSEAGFLPHGLAGGRAEFSTIRGSEAAPLRPILDAQDRSSRPAAGGLQFSKTRIPRTAACFPFDLALQDVAYRHAGKSQL
jgi:hypothetical protein